jgi:hypothetical protein
VGEAKRRKEALALKAAEGSVVQRPTTRYFHGGDRGLKVGDHILPPSNTGQESASDFGAAPVHRRDRVYVSKGQSHAEFFASGTPDPIVYEVEPEGKLEPDRDCTSGVSFACPKAKIVAIHEISAETIEKYRKMMLAAPTPRKAESKPGS